MHEKRPEKDPSVDELQGVHTGWWRRNGLQALSKYLAPWSAKTRH